MTSDLIKTETMNSNGTKSTRRRLGSWSPSENMSMSNWAASFDKGHKRKKGDTQQYLDRNFPLREKISSSDQDLLGFWFARFVILTIIINSAQIGVLCQWAVNPRGFINVAMEGSFTMVYFIEAFIKLRLLGIAEYFNIKKGIKHPVEFLIACCGALQLVWLLYDQDDIDGGLQRAIQAMSLLRLLRIIRVLRVLTGVPQLAITIGGLVGSAAALGWILLLLILFAYAFAVYFVLQVNDPESPDFKDLLTAMRTMASVVVLDKWTDILEIEGSDHSPVDKLLLYIPFYTFAIVAVFGISNIIIGVIVDFTAETKQKLRWSEQRAKVAAIGTVWEESLVGSSLEHELQRTASEQMSEDAAIERERVRVRTVDAILEEILESEDTRDMFPPGMKAEDIRLLLDFRGEGRVLHEELCVGLGRLLLCSEGQLRVLSLVNQAKTRRQLGDLGERVGKLEKAMALGFEEIKGLLQGGVQVPRAPSPKDCVLRV